MLLGRAGRRGDSGCETCQELQRPGDNFIRAVPSKADALHGRLGAEQAGAGGEGEGSAADLVAALIVDIQVDQPGRGVAGFQIYTLLLDRQGFLVERQQGMGPQIITIPGQGDQVGKCFLQVGQRPGKERFSSGGILVFTGYVEGEGEGGGTAVGELPVEQLLTAIPGSQNAIP